MNPGQPESNFIPAQGRLLGVDYGTRRVGLALATPDRTFSSAIENYDRRNERLDARFFRILQEEYRPVGIIVGLPVHANGDEGLKAAEARKYGTWLGELTGLPVVYWDERYTSSVAEELLQETGMSWQQRKKRIDKVAAQIMLQSYLDAQRAPSSSTSIPVQHDDEAE